MNIFFLSEKSEAVHAFGTWWRLKKESVSVVGDLEKSAFIFIAEDYDQKAKQLYNSTFILFYHSNKPH